MIRVLIVDDHDLVRAGLASLLSKAGFEVVGGADSADAGVAAACAHRPDVVLWDLAMPGGGLTTLPSLPQRCRVVVLTALDDPLVADEAARAGARAFLPKSVSPQQLIETVRKVASGQTTLPRLPHLTPRERQVLDLLAEGCGNSQIADAMKITVKTVESYLERLKDKLGRTSTADLRAWATRRAQSSGGG